MFDRISSSYDRLNRFFSMGIDVVWRSHAVKDLKLTPGMSILDCSAGTGDMSLEAHRQCSDIHTILYDPAESMLQIAGQKASRRGIRSFELKCGAAEQIDYPDCYFDRFMVAFGIRNFQHLEKGLGELHRVLKPGGSGVILEFTPDRSKIIDFLFKWYMWWVMRPIGGAVSKDKDAYRYLAETIQKFPSSEKLVDMYRRVGFSHVEAKRLSLGIATRFLLTK